MFDNCWTYNKKNTRVYEIGLKLSEVFDMHIDNAMKKLGYCCGQQVSHIYLSGVVHSVCIWYNFCSIPSVHKYSTATVEMIVPFLGMPLIGVIKTGRA